MFFTERLESPVLESSALRGHRFRGLGQLFLCDGFTRGQEEVEGTRETLYVIFTNCWQFLMIRILR